MGIPGNMKKWGFRIIAIAATTAVVIYGMILFYPFPFS